MSRIKRITDKTITLAIIFAVAVALILGTLAFAFTARAADGVADITEFEPTELSLSNPHFTETSGSYPASPSSWTASSTGKYCGVVDLASSAYTTSDGGNKKYGLDQYDEYKNERDIPKTIFGADTDHAGSDTKALLVNTAPLAEANYYYKSTDMTFAANSFYRISAWVKTGDFNDGTGATIKLNGLGTNCAFTEINTVKDLAELNKENNYGWVKYTFYVRTSAALSKTVSLTLGIGDAVDGSDDDTEGDRMPTVAHGYAFFDTITAERISSYDFAFETGVFTATSRDGVYQNGNGTAMAIDLYDVTPLTVKDELDNDVELGTFSNVADFTKYWNTNAYYDKEDEPSYAGVSSVLIYDSKTRIPDFEEDTMDKQTIKFTQNPWAPLGRAEYDADNDAFVGGENGNILVIHTPEGAAARGVASPDVTIERYKFYRFSVWIKGDSIKDGNGISIAIKGQKNDSAANNKLSQWTYNQNGDSEDKAHYGWKEYVAYIKGSMLSDLNVHFELWLGTPGGQSSGIAMFDNVTFTELSYSDYTAMSAADGGSVVELDGAADDTGMANGTFSTVGDHDELKCPLPAASWTYYDAGTVSAVGFSKKEVNTDNAIYGIIPADVETFTELRESGELAGVTCPATMANAPDYSALLISSSTKTAICYQSSTVTAAVDKAYKLTVNMAVDGVSADSYGASLVLKTSDNNVVATIEGIKSTNNAFKPFIFYIDAPLSEKSLYVEIWLGLNDRIDNAQKLSDGNIYVKRVSMVEWVSDDSSSDVKTEYANMLQRYSAALSDANRIKTLDYAMISFNSPSLDYYDAYTYNQTEGFTVPYGWSVESYKTDRISGLVDTDNMKNIDLYPGFERKDQTGRMLYIHNTEPNYTVYTYDHNVSLVANTHYRLDVTIKVRLSEEDRTGGNAIGAGINLTGTVQSSFENIKDTTTLVSEGNEGSRDYESFKTYTFYISTGSNGGTVGLNISLGGNTRSTYISGKLVVADVALTAFSNSTAYENATKSINENYEKIVELSAESEDDDNDHEEVKADEPIAWWLIPTIIFSAALVLAILVIIVVRLRDHFKKKKKTVYTSDYDREKAAKDIEKLASGDDDGKKKKRKHEDDLSDEEDYTAPEPEDEEAPDEEQPEEEPEADEGEEEQPEQKEETPAKKPADDLDD